MRAIRLFVFDHHGRERGVQRYVFVTNLLHIQYRVSRVRTES